MGKRDLTELLDTEGPAAPPRPNGELTFTAPWEARVFGLTMSLYEAGAFEWEEFRSLLIDEIRRWEAEGHDEEEWSYYERWAAAFERLATSKDFFSAPEIERRAEDLAARPHGHDHR